MLKFGGYIRGFDSYRKYRYYKVQDIKNSMLSYMAGAFFSRFAINPQMFLRMYLDQYKYYLLMILGLPIASLVYLKSSKSPQIAARI